MFSPDYIEFDEEGVLFDSRRHHEGHGVLLLGVFLGVVHHGFVSGSEDLDRKLYVSLDSFAFVSHVSQCAPSAVHFVSFVVAVNVLEVDLNKTNDGIRPQSIVI